MSGGMVEFLSGGLSEGLWFLCDFLAVEGDMVIKVIVDLDAPHAVIWYVNNF